jgi:hypothetical protein
MPEVEVMLKKDEIEGPSCLTRAADNEPLFVLRANDENAPKVVRLWAQMYRDSKGTQITAAQYEKYIEALRIAQLMEIWKKAFPS